MFNAGNPAPKLTSAQPDALMLHDPHHLDGTQTARPAMNTGSTMALSSSDTFVGFARVDISCLTFGINNEHRVLSNKNVNRLRKVYDIEGCRRLEEENVVDALIKSEDLHKVEGKTSRTSSGCDDASLVDSITLDCLTGFHRLRAATFHLRPNDRWWIVRLHTGLHQAATSRLREQSSKEASHTDGEIFHKIRTYHQQQDHKNEKKWLARLSHSKRKDLKQLLGNQMVADAFDQLLPWPALWTPIQLGALHRLLTMRCDEEILHGLLHVVSTWRKICSGIDLGAFEGCIDQASVRAIESLAPFHSTADKETVEKLYIKPDFLPAMLEPSRSVMKMNILSIKHTVPTLYTFFEDLKYLEPAAKALRLLVDNDCHKTLFESFAGSFFEPTLKVLSVQHAGGLDRSVRCESEEMSCQLAYQQLWLFALRYYPQMTNMSTRKTPKMSKPSIVQPSPQVQQAFASLALRIGFRTSAITQIASLRPSKLVARQILDQNGIEDAGLSDDIAALLDGAVSSVDGSVREPSFFGAYELTSKQRCGRPFEDDHLSDRSALFLPQMYGEPGKGIHITTFYRKWSMFQKFFDRAHAIGYVDEGISSITPAVHPVPQATSNKGEELMMERQRRQAAEEISQRSQETITRLHDEIASLRAKCNEDQHSGPNPHVISDEISATIQELSRQVENQSRRADQAEQQLGPTRAELLELQNLSQGYNQDLERLSTLVGTLEGQKKELQQAVSLLQQEKQSMQQEYAASRVTVLEDEEQGRTDNQMMNQPLLDTAYLQDLEKIVQVSNQLNPKSNPLLEDALLIRTTRSMSWTTMLTEVFWPSSEAQSLVEAFDLGNKGCKYDILVGREARRFTGSGTEELLECWQSSKILWFVREGFGLDHLHRHRTMLATMNLERKRKRLSDPATALKKQMQFFG